MKTQFSSHTVLKGNKYILHSIAFIYLICMPYAIFPVAMFVIRYFLRIYTFVLRFSFFSQAEKAMPEGNRQLRIEDGDWKTERTAYT